MNAPELNLSKLERLYVDTSAELRSLRHVIDNLKSENEHLRHIVDLLIASSHGGTLDH